MSTIAQSGPLARFLCVSMKVAVAVRFTACEGKHESREHA